MLNIIYLFHLDSNFLKNGQKQILAYASKYTAGHYWGHSYMDLIPCKPVKEICDGETCSD
jgi:hypothetical protein